MYIKKKCGVYLLSILTQNWKLKNGIKLKVQKPINYLLKLKEANLHNLYWIMKFHKLMLCLMYEFD